MTTNLLALYLSSIAIISLLGFFSRRNKRLGWVKQRHEISQDLVALQDLWAQMGTAAQQPQASFTSELPLATVSCEQTLLFTGDLARMQQALGQTTVAPSRVEETVNA